jgi:hypothetical protein
MSKRTAAGRWLAYVYVRTYAVLHLHLLRLYYYRPNRSGRDSSGGMCSAPVARWLQGEPWHWHLDRHTSRDLVFDGGGSQQ